MQQFRPHIRIDPSVECQMLWISCSASMTKLLSLTTEIRRSKKLNRNDAKTMLIHCGHRLKTKRDELDNSSSGIAASCTIRVRRRECARAPRPYPGVYTEWGYGHVAGHPLILPPRIVCRCVVTFVMFVFCVVCMLCRAMPVSWGGPLGHGGLVTVGCHYW